MAERNVKIRIQDQLFNEAFLRKDASAEKNKYKLHRYIPPNSSDRQNAKLHKEIRDFAKSINWWNSYAEKIPPVVYFSEWIASRRGGLLRKNIEYINKNISQLDITPRAIYNKTISVFLVFLISGYLLSLFFDNTLYKLIILAIFFLAGQKISEYTTIGKIKEWSEPDYTEKLVYNIALVNEAIMSQSPIQLLERVADSKAFGPIAKEFSDIIKMVHMQKVNPFDAIIQWSENQNLESLRDVGKIMRLKELGVPIDVEIFIERAKRDSLRAIDRETKKSQRKSERHEYHKYIAAFNAGVRHAVLFCTVLKAVGQSHTNGKCSDTFCHNCA